MISTQRPPAMPHVLYSNLPATSRRAHNVPFLLGRAAPSASQPAQSRQPTSYAPYTSPRMNPGPLYVRPNPTRRAPPPPRRNAISYHPSQSSPTTPRALNIHNPFADPPARSAPVSSYRTSSPSPARLISSGHTADPLSSPLPLVRVHPPRDHSARLVAKLLLNRAGRARPMRGPVRQCGSGSGSGSGYVRSGLSVCVAAEEDE